LSGPDLRSPRRSIYLDPPCRCTRVLATRCRRWHYRSVTALCRSMRVQLTGHLDASRQFDPATQANMISLAKQLRQLEKNSPPVSSGIDALHDGRLIDVSLARILPPSPLSTGTLCFVRNVLGIRNSMVSFRPRIQQIIKLRSSIRLLERPS
jgi:hypothetical protein